MRRDWSGMRASANLVMRHAAESQRRIERGDVAGAAYWDASAAEAAVYAEICARRAYGFAVYQQLAALQTTNEVRRRAWTAIH